MKLAEISVYVIHVGEAISMLTINLGTIEYQIWFISAMDRSMDAAMRRGNLEKKRDVLKIHKP